MAEDIVDRLDLESKHRKEKKELQAQIQALKKAAKNDKTKKKELTAEITRLELEQEERHKREMATIEQAEDVLIIPDQDVEEDNMRITSKVSKAQKRRDKKQQQEKDREAQIKIQDKQNLLGPRHIELQAINAKLKEKKLQIYSIPSDGDCLYNAIAHQLSVKREKTITTNDLRANCASYIRNNKDDFMPFLSNPQTFDMLTDNEFEDYCNNIDKTKAWGGQLEIRALSNYLMCPISVIQATGPDSIEQGTEFEGPPLIITYHRHMYSLGEHFNSTQPLREDEES
ncbi:deubiquitinase OTUD6B [Epargyreus clarus]|uniref:deubiquitinase OTUD6B n=1 Tax=Epargyreus clarus TaxID=520877 RepID=UPI003C2CC640